MPVSLFGWFCALKLQTDRQSPRAGAPGAPFRQSAFDSPDRFSLNACRTLMRTDVGASFLEDRDRRLPLSDRVGSVTGSIESTCESTDTDVTC